MDFYQARNLLLIFTPHFVSYILMKTRFKCKIMSVTFLRHLSRYINHKRRYMTKRYSEDTDVYRVMNIIRGNEFVVGPAIRVLI